MKRISYLVAVILVIACVSCSGMQAGGVGSGEKKVTGAKTGDNRLKGTTTEIMNTFKSLLTRYELETFSMVSLKIVTKRRKLDEASPVFEKYKRKVVVYEQYDITITREEEDAVVDIVYTIAVQEMNMKTNVIGFKVIARDKDTEKDLLKKVRRMLYGA